MREYAREQKEKNTKKQQDEIESLENLYLFINIECFFMI